MWATRTLMWHRNRIMSKRMKDLEAVLPKRIWDTLDDAAVLPTIDDIKLGRCDVGLTKTEIGHLWGNSAQKEVA
jgi:hypothetical protein